MIDEKTQKPKAKAPEEVKEQRDAEVQTAGELVEKRKFDDVPAYEHDGRSRRSLRWPPRFSIPR